MKKKLQAILIVFALVFSMLPMNVFSITAEASGQNAYGIPDEIEGCWHYVGKSAASTAAETWMRGNAYKRHDHDFMDGKIDTSIWMYRQAYEELQKDEYLKSVRICIIYIEGCAYSKSYLPLYRIMAKDSGAKVLLVDVNKYETASLLPYYDCMFDGTASPIILYKGADGVLHGKGGVHSTDTFAEILETCGYEVAPYDPEDTGYDKEQEKKDEVLNEVNRQRISQGLLPLSTYQGLQDVADFRAVETVTKMAHERPNGTMFNTALEEAGLSAPNLWGENLVAGVIAATPQGAMVSWMNSPGHRANILGKNYTHIGVGHYTNTDKNKGPYKDYWVQLFSGTCRAEEITLDQQTVNVVQGTPITDMGITVALTCKTHGTTTMPLIDEMCTGYDMEKTGEQYVTVHYGDKTVGLYVTVGKMERAELTKDMVVLSEETAEYNGLPHTPEVKVNNPSGEYPLMEGYSYAIEYYNNIEVGTASVTVTGKGNYKGSVTKTFQIVRKDISRAELNGLQESYEYTGKEVTPSFGISCDGITLHEGRDYTVTYRNNTGVMKEPQKGRPTFIDEDQKAVITIEGIGNYTGTLTAEFGFKMNETHKLAQQMLFKLNPSHSTDSTYDLLKLSQEAYSPVQFDMILRGIEASIQEKREAGQLEAIRSCPLAPEVNDRINDYYRFVRECVDEVAIEEVIQDPAVSSSSITTAEAAGLEALVDASTERVQLVISDYAEPQQLKVDSSLYDTSNSIALDISLEIDGQKIADPSQSVTITVNIPDALSAEDDLVVLHYTAGGTEVLETRIDKEQNTLRFVTSGFSPFVITRRLEQYQASVNESAVNTGAEYGETLPAAPEKIKITSVTSDENGGKVELSWNEVKSDKNWNITGYLIRYADNERMDNAKSIEINSPKQTTAVISNILSDWCYVTVSSRATLAALGDFAGTESIGESIVHGTIVPKSVTHEFRIQKESVQNGTVVLSAEKSVMGKVITVTPKADEECKLAGVEVKAQANSIEVIDNADGTYSFEMPGANVTVSATFVKNTYAVTAEKAENGTVTLSHENASKGDLVTITATEDEEYSVSSVEVKAASSSESAESRVEVTRKEDGTYTFEMPGEAVAVSVVFAKNTYAVTAEKAENGTVTLSHENASKGELVTIKVSADEEYSVSSVEVKAAASAESKVEVTRKEDGTYTFEMPGEAVTVSVVFAKNTYAVTAEKAENGTVTLSHENASKGELVTIKVSADEEYNVSSVEVKAAASAESKVEVTRKEDGIYTFEMPGEAVTVSVVFVKKVYVVTAGTSENGTVTLSHENASKGELVTIKVSADEEYRISSVVVNLGAVEATNNGDGTYTFEMPGTNVVVNAVFVKKTYAVTAEKAENGTVTLSHENASKGELVTITATAFEEYNVSSVEVKAASSAESAESKVEVTRKEDGTYTFEMPGEAVTVSVAFAKNTYAVTAEKAENGTVTLSHENASKGDLVTIKVSADEEYNVSSVEVKTAASAESKVEVTRKEDGTYTFEMPGEAVTVSVVFAKNTYAVTAEKAENGTVTLSHENASKGDLVTITATAFEEYNVSSVEVKNAASAESKVEVTRKEDGTYTFEMPGEAVTVSVVFAKNTYAVTAEKAENGTVTLSHENASKGELVTIKVSADEEYNVSSVEVKTAASAESKVEVTRKEDGTYTFEMPGEAVTVSVAFAKKTYAVTAEKAENGTVTLSHENASKGDLVTITATAFEGHTVSSVEVKAETSNIEVNKNEDGTYTFEMPGTNVTVYTTFEKVPAPDEPTGPDNPVTPDEPTDPDNPVTPDEPTGPDNPVTPDEPTDPDNPVTPDDPTDPDNPVTPDEPTDPDNPVNPDTPSEEKHEITIPSDHEEGSLTISSESAKTGEVVKVFVQLKEGYAVDVIKVITAAGEEIYAERTEEGVYEFFMPNSAVTIEVVYKAADKPVDPDTPENPTDPDNPINPENPTVPDNPENPTGPDDPTVPDNPENPTDPDDPTVPDNPENPTDPDNPTVPDNPDTPTVPDDPTVPDNPDTPVNPDTPTKPVVPTEPMKPTKPVEPVRPADKPTISKQSANAAAPQKDSAVKTGDHTDITVWAALLGISVIAMTFALEMKRRKR